MMGLRFLVSGGLLAAWYEAHRMITWIMLRIPERVILVERFLTGETGLDEETARVFEELVAMLDDPPVD